MKVVYPTLMIKEAYNSTKCNTSHVYSFSIFAATKEIETTYLITAPMTGHTFLHLPLRLKEHLHQHGELSVVQGWVSWHQIQVEDSHHHPQSLPTLADTALQHCWWSDHQAQLLLLCG